MQLHDNTTEREALAIVRNLAEVKWMVAASPYPIKVYTDHTALKTLLGSPDNDAHGRIARWQDRLGEYDYELIHRSATVHFMGIADGMNRLPTRHQSKIFAEDTERMEAVVARVLPVSVTGTDIWARPDVRRAWAYRNLASLAELGRMSILAEEPTSFTKPERVSVTTKRASAAAERVAAVGERASATAKRVAAILVEQIEEEETRAEQIGEEETPEAKVKAMEARMDVLKEAWKDWLAEKDYRLLLL